MTAGEDGPRSPAISEKAAAKRRPLGRPFEPGKSGNPSGRPKVAHELASAFQAHGLEALEVLLAVMRNRKARGQDRIRAAEVILERGFGKALQPIGGPEGEPLSRGADVLENKLDALIDAMFAGDRQGAPLPLPPATP